MKITSITIKDFRAFQEETTIELANYITCISGHNGIGKSTILAILSNCCELKNSIGTHLNGSAFRGDFSDIVVGDEKYDTTGEKVIIRFKELPSSTENDIYVEELSFRTTFQTGNRFRLIPKKIKGSRDTEQKIKHPSYYLGLSRLYPVGESKKAKASRTPIEYSEDLINIHERIMSQTYGENTHATSMNIVESPKNKLGIKNDNFAPTANSSGQDNLSQIILTVLSFKKLKENLDAEYHGGLILIDELDATLHPAAQNKLFDYLYSEARNLNLQIVFTTHSLSLLEHVSNEVNKKSTNDIKISYLRKRENSIDEKINPNKDFYRLDLTNTYLGTPKSYSPILILTEDDVARWFLEKILSLNDTQFNIKLLDVNISWTHIINLITSNLSGFQNYIVILDPDLLLEKNNNDLKKLIEGYPLQVNESCSDILILPSINGENIESILWNYLSSLPANHHFFDDDEIERCNWNKSIVISNGPDSEKYSRFSSEKVRIKHWFNDNMYYLDFLFKFWAKDNEKIINDFIALFKSTYSKKYKNTTNNTKG